MAGAIAFGIVGDFSSADDVVQEALLKAYCDLGKLRDRNKFKVWLAGIVRSRAIDWLRRRKALPAMPFSQFRQGASRHRAVTSGTAQGEHIARRDQFSNRCGSHRCGNPRKAV
jgi:DNA-directed RNA polymerase specialized sigma24 family protein